MTSEKMIDEQIQRDYEAFYNKTYDGELPDGLADRFKTALWVKEPTLHQIHVQKIRNILSQPQNTWSVLQVGIVVNVIFMIPPQKIYKDFNEFLDCHEKMEAIRIDYNKKVDECNKQLSKKKARLMQLSGVERNNTVPFGKNPLAKA